jgi:hypothetical protein
VFGIKSSLHRSFADAKLFYAIFAVLIAGGAALVIGLSVFGVVALRSRRRTRPSAAPEPRPAIPKQRWTMPPLALLARPQWSTGRKVAMLTLRGYLVAAMILLIIKAIQLGGG